MGKRKYRRCRDEVGEREIERGKERKEEDRGEKGGGGGGGGLKKVTAPCGALCQSLECV